MIPPISAHTLRPARPPQSLNTRRLPHIPQTPPSSQACSPTYSTRLVVAILLTPVSAGSRRSARPLAVVLPLRPRWVSVRRHRRLRPFPSIAGVRYPWRCAVRMLPGLAVLEETVVRLTGELSAVMPFYQHTTDRAVQPLVFAKFGS